MRADRIKTFDWIGRYRNSCKYDLSRNELFEQDLTSLGIETSYEEYLKEKNPDAYFRETLAEIYKVESRNIIPTIGGTEAIFIAAGFLSAVSPRILVPIPEYEPIYVVPAALGSQVVIETDENIAGISSQNDSAMLTSPGNPEGIIREDTFDALADSLGRNSRIYVDETFTEYRFRNVPETLFHSDERAIVSGTMTKFFGLTKLRTGWIFAHDEDYDRVMRIKSMTSAHNPGYPLWLSANVLHKRTTFAEIIRKMLDSNLPVAEKFVDSFEFLEWKRPDSAPFGFVRYEMDVDSVSLCEDIYSKTGILLVPGSYFGAENSFRLCFFQPPEITEEAFEVLTSYFEEKYL